MHSVYFACYCHSVHALQEILKVHLKDLMKRRCFDTSILVTRRGDINSSTAHMLILADNHPSGLIADANDPSRKTNN